MQSVVEVLDHQHTFHAITGALPKATFGEKVKDSLCLESGLIAAWIVRSSNLPDFSFGAPK